MHVILGTAVLDDAQGLRKFKPSARLAGIRQSDFISARGLVIILLKYLVYRLG
jgi:hypothetical protein